MKTTLRQFPILGYPKPLGGITSIPWDMLAPHERQAQRNHDGQSLAILARRGGLSHDEALAILRDERWRSIPTEQAAEELGAMIKAYTESQSTT